MLAIKSFRSNLRLGMILIICSVGLYSLQNFIFHAPRDTVFYLFQDLAFVPIQVILVTLLLDKLLSAREKQEKLLKLNMVISAFFTEVGVATISLMAEANVNLAVLQDQLRVNSDWAETDFNKASNLFKNFEFQFQCSSNQLWRLQSFLSSQKSYLLGLFDNPNLMEHDTFTEMLWALFHVLNELESRPGLEGLPPSDLAHLANDVLRAYRFLLIEWVCYMKYLKNDYPYLFSLATRKNPFDKASSVIIEH